MRAGAILCHIVCGIGMLLCGALQFNQRVRKVYPRRHRVSGYLYIAFGVGCLAALRPLRSSTAKGHGFVATCFVEVASLMWLCATARALLHVKRGEYAQHRRWMLRSLALALRSVFVRDRQTDSDIDTQTRAQRERDRQTDTGTHTHTHAHTHADKDTNAKQTQTQTQTQTQRDTDTNAYTERDLQGS